MDLKEYYAGRNVLVTGAAGSIGSEIVRELLRCGVHFVRALDNNETALFELKEKMASSRIQIFFGDIRDGERINKAVRGVDFVFHTAALKHVPLCELSPFEAVKTNIIGTQNLIESAINEKIEKFITVSTNKAANPESVMGATKLISERLTLVANLHKKTAFSCVRFGNVLNSRGSVVPLFKEQIRSTGVVKVTDPGMMRFMIGKSKVANLILKAGSMAQGGEIFVFKAPLIRLGNLAKAIIEKVKEDGYNSGEVKIRIVGKRAGEKLYEDLLTESEVECAYEMEDMVVILPQIFSGFKERKQFVDNLSKFNFEGLFSKKAKPLEEEKLKELLRRERIL